MQAINIAIQGMTCAHCALSVTRQLENSGARDVDVDLGRGLARFSLEEHEELKSVLQELRNIGFDAQETDQRSSPTRFLRSIEFKFGFCAIWTIPLFLHMFVPWSVLHDPWVQLVLCIPVFIVGLLHFGVSGIASLRTGKPNMDVLIITGITAAFVYSLIGGLLNLGPDYLFYETSAVITTLVLLGNLIEERVSRRTTSAIQDLSKLQKVPTKRVTTENGKDTITPIDSNEIVAGDILLVVEGERIPADGVIIQGSGSLDESLITGESLPVDKGVDSEVIGGTVLSGGNVRIRATQVGDQSTIAGIIRYVKDAYHNQPEIQKIGDLVSAWFVPAVIVIAIGTVSFALLVEGASFQEAFLRGIAVLVISCPCAMGLATPTAVMAGIGKASTHGILVRGGQTLEKLAQSDTIIFDKTGTLTNGQFEIRELHSNGVSEEELKSIVLGVEQHSTHPIAQSLIENFKDSEPFSFESVEEQKGLGIKGLTAEGVEYQIGSDALVENGEHDLYILRDGEEIGWIDIQDQPKSDAKETLDALTKLNKQTILLSGDSQEKCQALAESLNLSEIYSRKRPEEKLEIIAELQKKGAVAFVGDGINDAAALAQASVGITLNDASQVAIHSSEVVILSDRLKQILNVYTISEQTLRTVKQNLFWAFFYNVLAIPVAAAGYLNPMIAALTMAFSDVIVLGNSLRLRRSRLEPKGI